MYTRYRRQSGSRSVSRAARAGAVGLIALGALVSSAVPSMAGWESDPAGVDVFANLPEPPALTIDFPVTSFFDIFVDITVEGQMYEAEVPDSGDDVSTITLQNTNDFPVTLSNAGYFTSPTQIPLDNLNLSLQPGQSYTFRVEEVPEPGTLALFGGALLALGGLALRRISVRNTASTRAAPAGRLFLDGAKYPTGTGAWRPPAR